MKAGRRLASVAVSLAIAGQSPARATERPLAIEVGVAIGGQVLPLSVAGHFAEVGERLPEPGRLPIDDLHDKKHGGITYCYAFQSSDGQGRLELFDSDFGLHTARVSLVAGADQAACTLLSSEPQFIVGAARYSLSSAVLSCPPGFQVDSTPGTTSYTREWTQSGGGQGGRRAGCFWHSISITITGQGEHLRSIMVQNWEEPGC